jgi:hypothetical protein
MSRLPRAHEHFRTRQGNRNFRARSIEREANTDSSNETEFQLPLAQGFSAVSCQRREQVADDSA